MSEFKRPELAARLRKIAHDGNLANRVGETTLTNFAVDAPLGRRCITGCGSLLTVEDYRTCRQCVLERRAAQA